MERITVKNISKEFRIGSLKKKSALARFASLFTGKEPQETIWALKDISLRAQPGEIIGIIGKNGSGKSTLLRIIAGIYRETSGLIQTNGKIISLINLQDGLYPQSLTKDNIHFLCSICGMSRKEAKLKFNYIIEFAELTNYVNTKIYQCSEGMKQRLVFSVAIHSDPGILLLDEIFEAGDAEFQFKSANKIKELVKNGAAVMLISHDLNLIQKYCTKVLWIENGTIKTEGTPREVIERYLNPQAG